MITEIDSCAFYAKVWFKHFKKQNSAFQDLALYIEAKIGFDATKTIWLRIAMSDTLTTKKRCFDLPFRVVN